MAIVATVRANAPGAAGKPPVPQMFAEGYPRSFFWWTTCQQLYERGASAEETDRALAQLQGIASPSTYLDYFSAFKSRYPGKLVFLFSQGYVFSEKPTVYDPIDRSRLYAGHWVYFEGSRITGDVPAAEGELDIEVENPRHFRLGAGKTRRFSDDICLCALTADGQPDWSRSEQVKLVSLDAGRRVIRVRRGQYGTQPVAWTAGQAWAAAHASEPWGYQDGASWIVNYSPFCPKDELGRTAADILLEEFSSLLIGGGLLSHYDGLEFDVMPFEAGSRAIGRVGRGVDTDGDGLADGGYRDGVNIYAVGLYRFTEALRKRLGADKLFMADGNTGSAAGAQRCFGVLNGIESEWWPRWGDMDVTLWSYGLNLHRFWHQFAHPEAFSYFIHKFGGHDRKQFLSVPWNHHRLVMAAAQLVGAAFTSYFTPEPESGEAVGLWDEMVQGQTRQTGWLGQPLGPAVYLARREPDLLEGKGVGWPAEMVSRFQGSSTTFAAEGAQLRISAAKDTDKLEFRLENLPCRRGQDLLVTIRLRTSAREGYPEAMARLLKIWAEPQGPRPLESFVGGQWFDATFYFRNLPAERVNLRFEVEGHEPLWLSELKAYAHPDVAYRLFENGLVLANPGDRPFTFNLKQIAPARGYRRIRGRASQDPRTNDGSRVGESVTLAARDGLFLIAEPSERDTNPSRANQP